MVFIQSCVNRAEKGLFGVAQVATDFADVLCVASQKVCAVVKHFFSKFSPYLLLFVYPGSFIFGAGVGIAFPEFIEKMIGRISSIWQRQTWLFCGVAAPFIFAYGLPYTPYFASFLCGAHLGGQQALKP